MILWYDNTWNGGVVRTGRGRLGGEVEVSREEERRSLHLKISFVRIPMTNLTNEYHNNK